MLKKRFLIETINDQLKNISYVEHSIHRSTNEFMIDMLAGLIAYCLKANKPRIDLYKEELEMMKAQILALLNPNSG